MSATAYAAVRAAVIDRVAMVWASGNVYYGPKGGLDKLPAAFVIPGDDPLDDKCVGGRPIMHMAEFNCVIVGEYENMHSGMIALEKGSYDLLDKFKDDRKLSGTVTAVYLTTVQPDYNAGKEYSLCFANVKIKCQFFI